MVGAKRENPLRKRGWAVAGVFLMALLIRLWAAWHLPTDYDEPVYLQAGLDYAQMLFNGDLQGVIDYPQNMEHPPLVKLLYAAGILVQGRGTTWEEALSGSRVISAVLGALASGLVALIDPLAGLLVAVQTLMVKYTSQAYLEALPLFASIGAVLALRQSARPRDKWFWLSATALGVTAASKYSYFPVLVVILYLSWFEKRHPFWNTLLYLLAAGLTFLAFDPALWPDPLLRLQDSLLFHAQYSQSTHVVQTAYPWYQPFRWISQSWGYVWHPDVFFYFGFDGLIAMLAAGGLVLEWKKSRWLAVWLLSGLLFLLLWPTKWPQYTLVMLPAMCMLAAPALRIAYRKLREQETYWEWFGNMFPRPSRKYLVIGGVVVAVLLLLGGLNMLSIGLGKAGWSSMTDATTSLPSNMIYDLLPLSDGGMLVATENGLATWHPAEGEKLLDQWQVFNPLNSPLPAFRVLTLADDPRGGVWIGTASGLAHYQSGIWEITRAAQLGLLGDQVNALAIDSQGEVWVGTMAGLASSSAGGWNTYTSANSDLGSEAILALAVQSGPAGDIIWVGTMAGVSALDTRTNTWRYYSPEDLDLGWGGVADLLVDSHGRVWVGTLGGGISRWDGTAWTTLTTTNSELPYNNVSEITELNPGEFWISASRPDQSGGLLVRVVDDEWKVYRPNLTGFSGGEVMAVAQDGLGRLWFGTRTVGIDLFEQHR